jgi:HEPN domain-containing protein
MPNSIKRTGVDVDRMMQWLWWARSDYRAARLLLGGGGELLIQSAAFANTAIEKLLKTLHRHLGTKTPRSHNVSALFQTLKEQTQTNIQINESFLRLLVKAYKLRYPDDLEEDFNIALNEARLMVELDRTVKAILDRIVITESGTGKTVDTFLDVAIKENDLGILTNNAALDPSIAPLLFSRPSQSRDLRVYRGKILENLYTSAYVKDEPNFEIEGFVILSGAEARAGYGPLAP